MTSQDAEGTAVTPPLMGKSYLSGGIQLENRGPGKLKNTSKFVKSCCAIHRFFTECQNLKREERLFALSNILALEDCHLQLPLI